MWKQPTNKPVPKQKAATKQPAAKSSGQAWKDGDAKKKADAPPKKITARTKAFIGAGVLGVLVAAIVMVVVWITPPRDVLVIIIRAGYETNIAVPHNVYGKTTAKKLKEWAEKNKHAHVEVIELANDTKLTKIIDDTGASAYKKVLIFVTAHGGADPDGLYLVRNEADLTDDAKSRARLEPFLKQVAELSKRTTTLLVLDATQLRTHWKLGMFDNDFARQLRSFANQLEKDHSNFLILSASGEGQRSWASHELKQTVFGHYLVEGLMGEAERNSKEGRITIDELYKFVSKKVMHWAAQNRNEYQEPVLLPEKNAWRADVEIAVTDSKGYEATVPVFKKFNVPRPLTIAWGQCDELRTSSPSPESFAPHIWREYLESLLRYEQLLCLGEETAANSMQRRVSELRKEIKGEKELKLDSRFSSLTMRLAFGGGAISFTAATIDEIDEVIKTEKLDDAALTWLKSTNDREEVRTGLTKLLLDEIISRKQSGDLQRAAKVLGHVEMRANPVFAPRPAEAHYFTMMQEFRDDYSSEKLPPHERLAAALEVRLLAEKAAVGSVASKGKEKLPLYSEQVVPWIKSDIENADRERLLGQDKLFASQSDQWDKARGHFETARKLYGIAQKKALIVRQALRARDEALVRLPYYSRWLASRPVKKVELAQFANDIETFKTLWVNLNQLDEFLAKGPEKATIEDLEKGSQRIRSQDPDKDARNFRKIEREFQDAYDENFKTLQNSWHVIDNLLSVPLIPVGRRVILLATQREISSELHKSKDKREDNELNDLKADKGVTHERSYANAHFALLALGEHAYSTLVDDHDFERAEREIKGLPSAKSPKKRRTELKVNGYEIARRANGLSATILKSLEGIEKASFQKSQPLVAKSARLARRLDGAQAKQLSTLSPRRNRDPGDIQRKYLFHEFLCWQGERTFNEFWAKSKKDSEHFYQRTGKIFARDAEKLLSDLKVSSEQHAALKRKLDANLDLDIVSKDSDAKVYWTDNDTLTINYGLKTPKEVPPGFKLIWRNIDVKSVNADPEGIKNESKRLIEIANGEISAYKLKRQKKSAKRLEGIQTVKGFFRGRLFEKKTPIIVTSRPGLWAMLPPPPREGSISVHVDEQLKKNLSKVEGAVVFILDCSGSMKDNGLFEPAKSALLKVLESAKKGVPDGTHVSIWRFGGHSTKAIFIDNSVFPGKRWTRKSDLPIVRARLAKLDATGQSPILDTMNRAKRTDLDEVKGSKTMIVVTDGQDSRYRTDDLRIKLKNTYEDANIAIRIIGFSKLEDLKGVEAQFKETIESFRPKGKYIKAGNEDDLKGELEESLKIDPPFTLEDPVVGKTVELTTGEVKKRSGEISILGQNSKWYKVSEAGLGRELLLKFSSLGVQQIIRIKRGEDIRFNLREKDGRLVIDRDLLVQPKVDRLIQSLDTQDKEWRLSVFKNFGPRNPTLPLELKVTVESLISGRKPGTGTLQQARIPFIFFKVRGQGLKDPPTVRLLPIWNFGATAWKLEVLPWDPPQTAPILEAYWPKDNDLNEIATVTLGSKKDVIADGVKLISIVEEPREIQVLDKGKRPVLKDCLVIRLKHPEGNPHFAMLQGEGYQEHRFYSQANEYVGIFYSEKALNAARLEVHSLSVLEKMVTLQLDSPK